MERTAIVLFGSTGDLARKKLIPALSKLIENNEFHGEIICVGRRDFSTGQYKEFVQSALKNMHYISANFDAPDKEFSVKLNKIIKDGNCKNVVFYFATAPDLFVPILNFCKLSGIDLENVRIGFEKPFGYDLNSAQKLSDDIEGFVNYSQVFCIDHYLCKPALISFVEKRFEDDHFDSRLSCEGVESVQIVLSESVTVSGRGDFYDKVGAFRDVMQNHLLQVLALIAFERGEENAQAISEAKTHILKNLLLEDIVFGQYEGYLNEKGVSATPESKTDTFFALKLFINDSRWKGVPFYVKAGKGLSEKFCQVNLVMKSRDILTIRIQPDDSIRDAYENVFAYLTLGYRKYFVSWPEIAASWKFTDRALVRKLKLESYKVGSDGPKNADVLMNKDRRKWLHI